MKKNVVSTRRYNEYKNVLFERFDEQDSKQRSQNRKLLNQQYLIALF